MKRILFLITRADAVGGASIHTRDMAAYLRTRGWETLVGVGGAGPVTEALEKAGVPYHSLRHFRREISPWNDFLAVWEVCELIRRFRPDLVSTHTSKAGCIGRVASWLMRVPVLYTPHCWSFVDGFPKAGLYRIVEKFAAWFGGDIITVSENERQEALEKRVGDPSRIITIHNGMPDVPDDKRASPDRSPPGLVMVGRFEEQKDYETLIRALSEFKDLEWTADFVGDGPRLPELKNLAFDLGVADRVRFLGYRKDIADILSRAQVYLLITNWEGFPRSILEAMRAGLPVIASDVGGNSEAVKEGVNGHIVPAKNVTALAERLRELLVSPERRAAFGQAARERYERDFTFEIMAGKTIGRYETLIQKNRGESR